jgi:lipid-binding SYLF domain-containing protein
MNKLFCLLAISALTIPTLMTAASEKKTRDETTRRLDEAASVFTEIMAAQDKSIPEDLLEKAHCIVVVPGVKKGAFIVGGEFGKGFISCRSSENRAWSAPAALRLEGGSVGFQIGGSETDVVMLVTNERGVDKLLSSQFTLGGEGEVAAGPVGRTAAAETDAKLTAEILTWSRSRGVFAGIALKGATLRQDTDANESLYGKRLDNRDIVMKKMAVPEPARKFVSTLNQYSHARP